MCFSFSVLPPSERRESPLDCSSATTVSTADASTPPEAASTALRLWFWQTRPLVGEEGSPPPHPNTPQPPAEPPLSCEDVRSSCFPMSQGVKLAARGLSWPAAETSRSAITLIAPQSLLSLTLRN